MPITCQNDSDPAIVASCGLPAISASSHAFCPASRKRAAGIERGSTSAQPIPISTAGNPSMMNSQCQPRSPSQPSASSSEAESGEPSTLDTGSAIIRIATMRLR